MRQLRFVRMVAGCTCFGLCVALLAIWMDFRTIRTPQPLIVKPRPLPAPTLEDESAHRLADLQTQLTDIAVEMAVLRAQKAALQRELNHIRSDSTQYHGKIAKQRRDFVNARQKELESLDQQLKKFIAKEKRLRAEYTRQLKKIPDPRKLNRNTKINQSTSLNVKASTLPGCARGNWG